MILHYFHHIRSYAFIRDLHNPKPVQMGLHREEYFGAREEAIDACRESGYWFDIDSDSLRTH